MKLPNFAIEENLYAAGAKAVLGIDEVGRGSIAGPVVAASVILDPIDIPAGINDSKKLSARKREVLYELIVQKAKAFAIAIICANIIDKINIRQASLLAMYRAITNLALDPDYILIDGKDIIPSLPCKQMAIIKGDSTSLSIAAASILAKVTRDRIMYKLHNYYPEYDFMNNVGYGTQKHNEAIAKYGAIANIHRHSFAPIKQM